MLRNANIHGYCEPSMAYVSPLDGVAISIDPMSADRVLFNELRRAGEMIRKLQVEVESLKSKVE